MYRLAVLALLACGAYADQVILANGDRLSGSIQRLADGKLLVRTEMAGPVEIPWRNVTSMVTTQPLYVLLKNGTVLSGAVVRSPKGLRIDSTNASVDVARDEVIALRSYEEQLAYQVRQERTLAPRFLDPWTGFLDTGLSAARGNADVTTVSVGGNAVRTKPRNKLSLAFNSLYALNSTNTPTQVTANLRRGGFRYEVNLGPHQFFFLSGDGEFDALQKLDLRAVGGVGFGRHVLRGRRHTFDVFAGSTVNREIFATGLRRLSGEALLSEESSHRINDLLTIRQKLGVFPKLTDAGMYRLTFDSSAVTTLMRWLSWQVSVSDRYISDPVPGTLRNDILLTTGFRFNLLPRRF